MTGFREYRKLTIFPKNGEKNIIATNDEIKNAKLHTLI